MSIIYTDIEKTLVAYLKTALGSSIYVATKKAAADATQPEKQVILQVSWAGEKSRVTRFAGLIVDIYADTYEDASTLAFQVEALLRDATVDPIKLVSIIAGPVRIGEQTPQEKRSISAEVVAKATDI